MSKVDYRNKMFPTLLNIFVETVCGIYFSILWWIKSSK